MLETLHEPVPQTSLPTDRMKRAFYETVDSACDKWIDAVKHGRRAAEDLVDDCNYAVKKRPLASVGSGLLLGLMVGGVVGWAMGRRP